MTPYYWSEWDKVKRVGMSSEWISINDNKIIMSQWKGEKKYISLIVKDKVDMIEMR